MSLINEALKKAQRQRTEDPVVVPAPAPGAVSGMPTVRIPKRRPPISARAQMLIIGGSAALLLMAGAFAFVFLAADDTPPPAPQPRPVIAPVTVPALTPSPDPAPVAVKPEPTVTPAPAPAPEIKPTVAFTLPEPPASVTVKPAPAPEPVAPPKPAAPVANPQVYEFLDALRITGIRISDTDPKVIMNDRVFRLNDLVDRSTQLRLIKVEPSTLTFSDGNGYEYRKNF